MTHNCQCLPLDFAAHTAPGNAFAPTTHLAMQPRYQCTCSSTPRKRLSLFIFCCAAEGDSWARKTLADKILNKFSISFSDEMRWFARMDGSNLTPLEMPWQRLRATRLSFFLQEFGQREKSRIFRFITPIITQLRSPDCACLQLIYEKNKRKNEIASIYVPTQQVDPSEGAHTQNSTIEIIKKKRLQFLGSGSRSAITN